MLTLDMWLIIECEFRERMYRPAIKYRKLFNKFFNGLLPLLQFTHSLP